MNKLNYRQTEMLWAIVMAGSISGAARLLNISQPAVSRMLAQTEKSLGLTLFERVRGRLRPTPQVHSLFEEIEKTQRMMQRVNDLADALSEHGTGVLRLASIPSLAQFLVPRAVARFQQRHPELLLRLIDRLEAQGLSTFGEVMRASNMAAELRQRGEIVARGVGM